VNAPKVTASGEATLPYPHFVIIGAPKCGTSWLQGALGQHPNVVVVPDEIEYFSSNFDRQPVEWYENLFEQQVAQVAPQKAAPYVVGEKSARYCSLPPDRIRLVRRLLPDVRLVLMARDPVSRHWSHAKRYFSKPRHAEREGGTILTASRDRVFDFLRRTRFLGEYSTMVANWTAAFPADQLLLVSQEYTLANPRATFDAVLQHLGVSTDYDPSSIRMLAKQRNRGPVIEMPYDIAEFLESMFAAERAHLRAVFANRGTLTADHAALAELRPAR
jgi:hypothetical protein